jgi:hypothetical protein
MVNILKSFMSRKNILLFTTAIFVLLLALGGWFWCEKKREGASEMSQEEVAKQMVWYPIPELGIQIELPKNIADEIVYKYTERGLAATVNEETSHGNTVKTVSFSSKKLLSIDPENCSAEQSPLGSVTRHEGRRPDVSSPWWYVSATQFEGFFVYYGSPQSPCVFDDMHNSYVVPIIRVLYQAFYPSVAEYDSLLK